MIKAVIFDMDGVIIDSHSIAPALLVNTANKFGCDLTENDIVTWGSLSSRQFWTKIKNDFNLSESLEYLINQYDDYEEVKLYAGLQPIKGVINFLKALKNKNIKIGLATSASRYRMESVIDLFKIESYFDTLTCDEDVNKSKPSPEIFLKTAEKLNVLPESCLVIEDSENGIIAANNAKMKSIGYKGLKHVNENLEKCDLLCYDFDKLQIENIELL